MRHPSATLLVHLVAVTGLRGANDISSVRVCHTMPRVLPSGYCPSRSGEFSSTRSLCWVPGGSMDGSLEAHLCTLSPIDP